MTTDNPIGNFAIALRDATNEYLASMLAKAVDAEIITDDQRTRLIEFAKTNP